MGPVTNAAEAVGVVLAIDMLPAVADPVVAVMEAPAKVDCAAPLTPLACVCRFVTDCAGTADELAGTVPLTRLAVAKGAADVI